MTATVITAYLSEGLAAARPATPAITTGAIAFWYSTDTSALSFYDANSSSWVSVPISGGSTGAWATPAITSGTWGVDSTAHATKGNAIEPAVAMTIDKITYLTDGSINGHNLICTIWTLNTGTNALIAQQGSTATATGTATAGPITFTFSSPVSLAANTAYVILITDTSAASGTTTIDMYAGSARLNPCYPAMPSMINNTTVNGAGFVLSTNVTPTAAATLSGASTGPFAIMIHFNA